VNSLNKFSPKQPQNKTSNFQTNNFYFGAEEAEAEAHPQSKINLLEFFDDYLDIFRDLESEKFLIIGRKGSGKSAIAEYIYSKARDDSTTFVDFIRNKDISLHKLAQVSDGNVVGANHFFEWTILLKIITLIMSNESYSHLKELDNLTKFYHKNSGFVRILDYDVKEVTEGKNYEIGIEYLKRAFSGTFKSSMAIKSEKAPFYKIIPDLRKLVIKILTSPETKCNECAYYLFFDDLDIDFKATNEEDMKSLAELIRTAKYYNNDIFGKNEINAKIFILIRTDVISAFDTKTADISKIIQSYGIHLIWYDYNTFNNALSELPLKRLIDNRIVRNFNIKNIPLTEDPWRSFVAEQSEYKFLKAIFDITFARPRDVITFFKGVQSLKTNFPIQEKHVDRLTKNYCTKAVAEIKNELYAFYDGQQIEIIFSALQQVGQKTRFKFTDIENKLIGLRFTGATSVVIKQLFDYSIIGQISTESNETLLRFKYREPQESPYEINKDGEFTLHKMIHKYFEQTRRH